MLILLGALHQLYLQFFIDCTYSSLFIVLNSSLFIVLTVFYSLYLQFSLAGNADMMEEHIKPVVSFQCQYCGYKDSSYVVSLPDVCISDHQKCNWH